MNSRIPLSDLIEVTLTDPENFLKVRETLSRIGVSSHANGVNTLFQSCHILHKQGKYYIVHFKELFALDGRDTNFSAEDIARRNRIALLLEDWDLVRIVKPDGISDNAVDISAIKIIKYEEKTKWQLVPKYTIGRKRQNTE